MILGGIDPRQYSFKSSVGSGKGNGILGPVRVYYTSKNAQVVTDLQASCNKVVVKPISGCVHTSHCLFPVVVTSLEQVGC